MATTRTASIVLSLGVLALLLAPAAAAQAAQADADAEVSGSASQSASASAGADDDPSATVALSAQGDVADLDEEVTAPGEPPDLEELLDICRTSPLEPDIICIR